MPGPQGEGRPGCLARPQPGRRGHRAFLILDGTVIGTRLDRKATNISVLAAIGVRRDGQKVLLSIRNMGGESTAAWRQFLEDLDARGLKRPEFVIVDGAPGLEAALVALWGEDLPIQRCTVHTHRNLLAHAPKHMQDELTEDDRDMIYAETSEEIEKRRKTCLGGTVHWTVPYSSAAAQMATHVPGGGRQPVGKQAIGSSPSPASIRHNGSRRGQQTRSSA